MSDFFNPKKRVKTRKEHRCEYCAATIAKGTEALYESGVFDGEPFSRYACQKCQPYIGEFWDYVGGESFNIACEFAEFMDEAHPEAATKEDSE